MTFAGVSRPQATRSSCPGCVSGGVSDTRLPLLEACGQEGRPWGCFQGECPRGLSSWRAVLRLSCREQTLTTNRFISERGQDATTRKKGGFLHPLPATPAVSARLFNPPNFSEFCYRGAHSRQLAHAPHSPCRGIMLNASTCHENIVTRQWKYCDKPENSGLLWKLPPSPCPSEVGLAEGAGRSVCFVSTCFGPCHSATMQMRPGQR